MQTACKQWWKENRENSLNAQNGLQIFQQLQTVRFSELFEEKWS